MIPTPPSSRRRRHLTSTALATLAALALAFAPVRADEPVTLLYFGSDTCPYCQQMEGFLDALEEAYPDEVAVERFEVSTDPTARERWVQELAARGHEASGVPTVILGEQVWVGYEPSIAASIAAAVETVLAQEQPPVPDAAPRVGPDPPEAGTGPGTSRSSVDLPVLGEVGLAGRSPLVVTGVIAVVDGFNPCSLWVLSVLIAMVLAAGGSRTRLAAVGGTFLLITGLLYGAFIVGVFTVLGLLERLDVIRVLVAVLALAMGAVNVKDYVAYKRGPSLTIPDRYKPRIYRAGRAVREPQRSLAGTLGLTVVMAAGISLVELPCTAGFPVIWTGLLRTQGVGGLEFAGLLALYLAIYVLDELLVFGVALATLRVTRFQEVHGRVLKLVGGTVMLALGVVLVAAPELMERLVGAVLVVLGAVVLALVVAALHRRIGRGDAGGGGPSADAGRGGGTAPAAGQRAAAGGRFSAGTPGRARARPRRSAGGSASRRR